MTQAAVEPLGAVLPYFGGKRNMAGDIMRQLTLGRPLKSFSLYCEPFHGSAAVLMALREAGYKGAATANDLDALNHNLMRVLSYETLAYELYQAMVATSLHEKAYTDALHFLSMRTNQQAPIASDNVAVQLAWAYLIASWMGRNGETGLDKAWLDQLKGFCLRWTVSGGDPSVRWVRVLQSVPMWHKWLSEKTTYLCRDAIAVITDVPDDADVMLYCDPPYLHETRGNARYRVDSDDNTGTMFEAGDFHDKLACALDRFKKTRVVVSYYAHERLKRLYPSRDGWEHIDMAMNKALTNVRGAGDTIAKEVLIVRGGV